MPRQIALDKIRNIGIVAHIDAGKTTTTERILYYTGEIHRIGDVDDGTTTTDYMVQEQERGITITSAAVTCHWQDYQINIVDTPGHVDFTIEVERSLRVLDGMIGVFCGVAGVQPQSETVWRQANRYKIPRIAFVNKLDRPGAHFHRVIDSMKNRLDNKVLPIQIPVFINDEVKGVVDLLKMKAYIYYDDLGLTYKEEEIPVHLKKVADQYHQQIIENVADIDDKILNKYLNGEEATVDDIKAALRKGTILNKVVPVLCGSSLKNKGVQMLMDAIIDYLPSPIDILPVQGTKVNSNEIEIREAKDDAPFSALAFKIISDPYIGRLTFIRVYSGVLKANKRVLNATRNRKEKVNRLLRMQANSRIDIDEVMTGDIGAVVGLKDTFTGDTLCVEDIPVILEAILFPDPVISIAIEPKTKADQDKLAESLIKLSDEDPTFKVSTDEETAQTIISGMGELHLDVILNRLQREFKVGVHIGKHQVSYRETITKKVKSEGKFIRPQAGSKTQYGHVIIELEPFERGKGFQFINKLPESVIPKIFISHIEGGIKESLNSGVLASYPIVDIKATLIDGSYHETESTEVAYRIASSIALRDGVAKATPVLLEPMMALEVVVPEEYVGTIVSDIQGKRRGNVEGIGIIESEGQVIDALVPLAEMFGYVTDLRSQTQGRGIFTMEFSHYTQVPTNIAETIIRGYKVFI